jgi:hypothetical protein
MGLIEKLFLGVCGVVVALALIHMVRMFRIATKER